MGLLCPSLLLSLKMLPHILSELFYSPQLSKYFCLTGRKEYSIFTSETIKGCECRMKRDNSSDILRLSGVASYAGLAPLHRSALRSAQLPKAWGAPLPAAACLCIVTAPFFQIQTTSVIHCYFIQASFCPSYSAVLMAVFSMACVFHGFFHTEHCDSWLSSSLSECYC